MSSVFALHGGRQVLQCLIYTHRGCKYSIFKYRSYITRYYSIHYSHSLLGKFLKTPLIYFLITLVCVVDAMKMGNIVPRAGIEPTSLAFQASVLTITLHRLPDVTTIPTRPCLCSSLPERAV